MDIIATKAIEKAVTIATEKIAVALFSSLEGKEIKGTFEEGLESHINEVVNWCSDIQTPGLNLPRPLFTRDDTIPLRITLGSRQFGKTSDKDELVSEKDLIETEDHYLILGDPGSGKTTTLKRLAYQIFYSSDIDIRLQIIPIVIRLREITKAEHNNIYMRSRGVPQNWNLFKYISRQVLGLDYEVKVKTAQGHTASTTTETYLAEKPIEKAIPDVLNQINAVVMLDGLDELPFFSLEAVLKEINHLLINLTNGRLIVTCRSGEYPKNLEKITSLEILPLSPDQISAISKAYLLDQSNDFLHELSSMPYADTANRPLLLFQLAFLYRAYGYLPANRSSVYEKTIELLLEEWDSNRKICRRSKYSKFTHKEKRYFLSGLSHDLTHTMETTRFSEADLTSSYNRIHSNYNLPRGEAKIVAKEIESHTGIIVKSGIDRYEFSHRSIQEYLAADYLVKTPKSGPLKTYLRKSPGVVAVAIGLSSEANSWLARIFLSGEFIRYINHKSLLTLLNRLKIEQPIFSESTVLGLSVLKMSEEFFDSADKELKNAMLQFAREARSSALLALEYYEVEEQDSKRYMLNRYRGLNHEPDVDTYADYGVAIPSRIMVPVSFISGLKLNVAKSNNLLMRKSKIVPNESQEDWDHLWAPHNMD